jgi:transcriptional regulator with XRE-family HTH domain
LGKTPSPPDRSSARKPDGIDKRVGSRLMRLRKAKGLSQTELGDALGVKFQQIQRYESGKNRLGPSRLSRSAELFGVKIEYFFADEGIFESYVDQKEVPQTADTERLLDLFSRLQDEDLRKSILNVLEGLVASKSMT